MSDQFAIEQPAPKQPDVRCGTCAHAEWQKSDTGRALTQRPGRCGWQLTGVKWPWAFKDERGQTFFNVLQQRRIRRHTGQGCAQWRKRRV